MDLQAAADRLGVHYQTAYRWVRDGSLRAHKVGASYDIAEEEVERFGAERSRPTPPPRTTVVRSWGAHAQRLEALLLGGDELGARQLVERLHDGGVEVLALCEDLIAPVLVRIGAAWARGDINVAEEHRASAIVERVLARTSIHPRGRPRGTAVVCTPPGEEHGLPAAMATLCLRADRWQVHHLGTQVPPQDLARLVADVGADIVVLSVTNPQAKAAAEETAAALAGHGIRILVGRPGETLRDLLGQARG